MRLTTVWIALAGLWWPISGGANHPEPIRPDVIEFGAGLAEMEAQLADRCATLRTRVIDPPFLEDVAEIQHQIDCDGFAYFGEPRWAEFVFRDRVLELVWIMVDADDQERIVAALRDAFGPGEAGAGYVAFRPARSAWRFEPPEVLFYSQAVAEQVETEFD